MDGNRKAQLSSSKGSGRPHKENGSPTGGGGEKKPVRQTKRTGGASPAQKQKPMPALDTGDSTAAMAPSVERVKRAHPEQLNHPAPGPIPTLASPSVPPSEASTMDAMPASATPPRAETPTPKNAPRTTGSSNGACVRVLDYGVTAEQGVRRTMEDQHVMLAEGIPFFGVYDGHGGTQCAEYLRDNLHQLILGHSDVRTDPETAIVDSVVKADADFLQRSEAESNESGSVCAIALILDDTLVVGNVGDCEAVLCRSGLPILLTVKHNLSSNPGELARVTEAGGRVFHNRVGHPKYNPSVVSLAVTRAIGDAGFKLDEYTDGRRSGIIAVPDTKFITLTPEDEFLIIGCDGLWDVMSYEEVADFCARRFRSGETAQTITDELAQAALNGGGTDNVTAMLIHLAQRTDDGVPDTAVSSSTRNMSDEP